MLVKIVDGSVQKYPYSIQELRADHKNTSWSNNPTDAALAAVGVYKVLVDDIPSYNSTTQKVVTDSEPTLVGGMWKITRQVVDLTEEELTETNAVLEANIRSERDSRLETDVDKINVIRWNSFTTEQQSAWQAYRQALLDVPQQEGFPTSIEWPGKPE